MSACLPFNTPDEFIEVFLELSIMLNFRAGRNSNQDQYDFPFVFWIFIEKTIERNTVVPEFPWNNRAGQWKG